MWISGRQAVGIADDPRHIEPDVVTAVVESLQEWLILHSISAGAIRRKLLIELLRHS